MKPDPLRKERRLRAGNRLLSPLYLDLGGGYGDAVFLAGSGRSGTTWLSEVINHRREYRYVFEPFHPGKVSLCQHFRPRQYLRPTDAREEYLEPAREVLSGRIRSAWTDRFHRSFLARRRLIKDIRANLFLGWLTTRFPGLRTVLLLRHPCAVAASRIKLGWRSRIEEILAQEDLVQDHLEAVRDELRGAGTEFERHVLVWCVENAVPLAQLTGSGAHLVFYEHLCATPETELRRLFGYLEPGPDADLDRSVYEALKKVSPAGWDREASPPETSPHGWRRSVTGSQMDRAVEILGTFGLDGLYNRGPMPGPDAAQSLLRGSPG